jgi:RNA polymerase sigma-70 factor (ECF subfamily)
VSVEKRAFRIAEIATSNREDALDILQDAMYKLVQKYAASDPKEWGPLFQTILQSKINDWYRRNAVRNRFRVWFNFAGEDAQADPIQGLEDEKAVNPERQIQSDRGIDELELALGKLSLRQQQAFILRMWEGMDVAQTARVMKCSAGSVKTHYSRAIHALREQLGEHWS